MSFFATKIRSVYLWLFVALLRLGGVQNASYNSQMESLHVLDQGSLVPTTMVKQTSGITPTYIRRRRASPSPVTSFCITPPQPNNGGYKLDPNFCDDIADCKVSEGSPLEPGSQLVYRCNPGYKATANTDVYCRFRGKWSAIPECIEEKCDSLNSVSTMVSCTRFNEWINCDSPVPPRTRAEVACRHGYKRDTDFITTRRDVVDCNMNGKWEPEPIRCVPVCGVVITHQQPLVYGGTVAKIGDFPWHASLFLERRTSTGNRKDFRCGGTIIQTNLVLTAAHCVYDERTKTTEDPRKLSVITGNIFRDYDSPVHNPKIVRKAMVKNIYMLCNYYGLIGNYASDIALLELEKPFEFSSILLPACLDDSGYSEQSLEPGVFGKVAGFGRTETGETSGILQTITVPYISYSQCKTPDYADQNQVFISNDKFCGGYNNGSAVCEGDSGGGLVFRKSGLWYVRGIVSVGLGVDLDNGEKTCDRYSFSLYTKVSSYLTWIKDVLFYLERNEPYPSCSRDSPTSIATSAMATPATAPSTTSCLAPSQPANGKWQVDRKFCKVNTDCSVPEGTAMDVGTQLIYSCASKFTVQGSTEVRCSIGGKWTSIPICVRSEFGYNNATSELDLSDSCSLTNGTPGFCTLLKNCQTVLEELEGGKSPDKLCRFSGLEPIVCCPMTMPLITTTSPLVDQVDVVGDRRGAIAKKKCMEYSQYANASTCPPFIADNEQAVTISVSTGKTRAARMEFPHMAAIGFQSESNVMSRHRRRLAIFGVQSNPYPEYFKNGVLYTNHTKVPGGVSWYCGGTLISETFVLTSAACVKSKTLGDAAWVRLGDLNLIRSDDGASPEDRRIIERIPHPEYKPPAVYHDIALLRLESPVPFNDWIKPACLHTAPSAEAREAVATGWGRLEWTDEVASPNLMKVTVPLVDLQTCKTNWTFTRPGTESDRKLPDGIIENLLICAGAKGKDICQGDAGGPLVIPRAGSKKEVCMSKVIGVISLGRLCGIGYPALYTRVYNYVPWIESIVWGQG